MNYKNSTEKKNDGEILSAEDEKIRSLIGSLKRVDAPKDFDFRVKARIASAKPNNYRPQFLPVLRYILPLGLILLISAAVVFNSVYFGNEQNIVPTVSENQIPKKNLPNNSSSIEQTGDATISKNIKDKTSGADVSNSNIAQEKVKSPETLEAESKLIAAESTKKAKLKVSQKKNSGEDLNNSRVSALTTTKQLI
ncbi:MAG: hypothetical protein M3033_10595, partial [Acidobacteriota bacterium]|nr:hypothetical protein [Acidobacteriota bacterium]